MALFPMSCVLRRFPFAAYHMYASTKTLVRPCSSKKALIYEMQIWIMFFVDRLTFIFNESMKLFTTSFLSN
jgi:hypothetical protein